MDYACAITQPVHFSWPCPVYYEDTDGQGFLYHGRCMNYFERARSEWLRSLGLQQVKLLESRLCFVISKASLDYHRPAFLEDQLTATVSLRRLRRTSMLLSQVLYKAQGRPAVDATLIVSGEFQVAFINQVSLKPVAMPDEVFDAFASLA